MPNSRGNKKVFYSLPISEKQVSELISLQTNRKEEEDVASQITECESQMEQVRSH